MINFDHVEDNKIRDVLQGNANESSICYAIDETLRHAAIDQRDENIPFNVSDQRFALAYEACESWNETKSISDCVNILKAFWSI